MDPDTAIERPEGQVGEIWVNGPNVTRGYWGRVDETRSTFHAYLDNGSGPFLRTGDLGFVRDGQLYVTGRLKDVLIIRGRNLYPHDIDRAAPRRQIGGCGPDAARRSRWATPTIRRSCWSTRSANSTRPRTWRPRYAAASARRADTRCASSSSRHGRFRRRRAARFSTVAAAQCISRISYRSSGRRTRPFAHAGVWWRRWQLRHRVVESAGGFGTATGGLAATRSCTLSAISPGRTPLTELGIDSLKGVELVNVLSDRIRSHNSPRHPCLITRRLHHWPG